MAMNGPNTMDIEDPLNAASSSQSSSSSADTIEPKQADYRVPESLKAKAPSEWQSAGYAQYIPFTSVKPDAETYKQAEEEWQPYADSYMQGVNAERYHVDLAEKEQLETLKQFEDLPGNPMFVRDPSLARRLNEIVPVAKGFGEEEKQGLEKKLGVGLMSQLRQYNTAGSKPDGSSKKVFAHAPVHPSEWLANRHQYAEQSLPKAQRKLDAILTDAGFTEAQAQAALAAKKPSFKSPDGTVSKFHAQSKPIINAFQKKLKDNLEVERKRVEDQLLAEQMKNLQLASKVRNDQPKSYADAAGRRKKF